MQQAPNTFRTLRRFATAAIKISPRHATEAAIVTLVLSVTEGVGLLLLIPLLQLVGVTDQQQGALSSVVSMFEDALGIVGFRPSLGLVLGVYVVIIWLQSLLQRRESVLSALLLQDVVTTLRNRLYRAIAGTKWIYLARTRLSNYTQLLTTEMDRVGTAAYSLIEVIVMMTTSLVYVGIAVRVSPALTGIVLLCGVSLALTMRTRLNRALAIGEATSVTSTNFYAAISEHLASLKIARSYGAGPHHARTFAQLSQDLNDVGLADVRSQARFRHQLALGSAALLAAIVYTSYVVLAVSTAQLLLLLFLFARLVPRLTGLYGRAHALASALPAFDAVLEAEHHCLATAEPVVDETRAIELTDRIEFERVTFDYGDQGQRPAAQDITLSIAAGATTAIVGPSGGGKSTLADLLMGLLTPLHGRILVDGTPLGPDHLDAWRAQIGYVAQETFLSHDSVRANLLWARPDADEEELWRALRLAMADEFVAALPGGLDTVVGDRGVLVSGGERQRLSLARALLRRPTLLILDEATSSLDSENEGRIQRAIESLHQQMTIVVITHRFSTIRGADMIHVVDRARLVESGWWDDLMARPAGRFRELCVV